MFQICKSASFRHSSASCSFSRILRATDRQSAPYFSVVSISACSSLLFSIKRILLSSMAITAFAFCLSIDKNDIFEEKLHFERIFFGICIVASAAAFVNMPKKEQHDRHAARSKIYVENGIKSAYLHGNCRCFYMFCLFSLFVSNFAGFRMTVRAGVCKSWELVTGTCLGT